MIIEDADKLRHWLTAILQPLCDADPAALAKYVLALIKKDKPEKELRQSMSDQLDVFLQHETKVFIDRLFELLSTREYLTKSPPPIIPKEDPAQGGEVKMDYCDLSSQESLSSAGLPFSGESGISSNPSDLSASSTSVIVTSSGIESGTGSKDDGKGGTKRDRKDDERERNRRGNRRSRSPARRGAARAGRSRSPRVDRVRDRRYHPRKIRHERDPWDRRRSRSPLRNRSASPARNRSRTPPRYRRHSRSRSRSRSLTDTRGRSRSPAGNSLRDKGEKKEGLLPVPMNLDDRTAEGGLKDVGEKPSIQSVIVKAGAPIEKLDKGNRCRDFDEKGLCMRGELCPFDHGSDPVVLEDVVIPGVTNAAGNVDFNRALQAGGYGAASTSVMRPSVATMGEYYPDNPAMDPSGWGNPVFRPRGMSYDPILRGGRGGMMPRGPPMGSFPPQRELISVPVMGMQPNSQGGDPHGQHPPMVGMHHHPARGMHMGRGRGRGGFDHSRLGFKASRNYANCSLEVKKVPREQNNIMDLNSHFQKFGKIVNIQINFENDPEAALVTFSSPTESQAAYRSTEAVLNNRFIRVFWHNKEKENEESMEEGGPLRLSVRDRLGGHEGDDKQDQDKILVSDNNLTKTVYNPTLLAAKKTDAAAEKVQAVEAIKKSQEMLAAQESLKKKQEEKKKEALKLINDLRKRKQDMMSEQIKQQKKLISKLESGKGTMKPEEREQLMNLIKSLQDSIEKLKKDLDEGGAKALAAQPVPKSKEETQREMLDAELELYNKEQEGGDTIALQNKILDLRAKSKSMGMTFRGRGGFRGSPRGFGGRGRGGRNQQRALRTVDRRPTRVQVTGFPVARLPEILPHFSQFGTITEYETDHQTPSMILNFESRKSAEVALANAKMFGDTPLMIEWVLNGAPEGGSQNTSDGDTSHQEIGNGASIEDEELGDILAHEILLTYEEEEEDEMEKDRSWRR